MHRGVGSTEVANGQLQLSLIIPVHNNPTGLRRTISALGRELESKRSRVEIVVVDDGSTDTTAGVATELTARLGTARLVTTANYGPSAARNAGAEHATGPYLAFLDANDEPLPGWLASITSMIQADPKPGIVHVQPLFDDASIDTRGAELLPGCFAIERRLFEQLGGYDENLWFAENSDLVERAHRLCREHELVIRHDDSALLRVNDLSNPRRYDRPRLDAMEHLLNRDAERLRLDPGARARLAGIGAVTAVRLGEFERARQLARVAVRAKPLRVDGWLRLAAVWVPPLARSRWGVRQATSQ